MRAMSVLVGSGAKAACRLHAVWLLKVGTMTEATGVLIPVLDLKLAIWVSQKSAPWYSPAPQKVSPSDGSTTVLLKSPTRLSGVVLVPAATRTGVSIVPDGSDAIRSVTYIDQNSFDADSLKFMPIEPAGLMSQDRISVLAPPTPAGALPAWRSNLRT